MVQLNSSLIEEDANLKALQSPQSSHSKPRSTGLHLHSFFYYQVSLCHFDFGLGLYPVIKSLYDIKNFTHTGFSLQD